jgi:hypothetical protein
MGHLDDSSISLRASRPGFQLHHQRRSCVQRLFAQLGCSATRSPYTRSARAGSVHLGIAAFRSEQIARTYSKMSYNSPGTPSLTGATFQHQSQQQPRPHARDAGLPNPKHAVEITPPSPPVVPGRLDAASIPAGPASATLPCAPPASMHHHSHFLCEHLRSRQ